jgi:hypothetical protein
MGKVREFRCGRYGCTGKQALSCSPPASAKQPAAGRLVSNIEPANGSRNAERATGLTAVVEVGRKAEIYRLTRAVNRGKRSRIMSAYLWRLRSPRWART